MSTFNDVLFTERFRPSKIEHLILPDRISKKLEKGVYQNFLFVSGPGTGKTSAAKALVKQFKHPYLYINVSDESGVETLRNRIKNYVSEADLLSGGKKKIIILDEFDGVSDQFYKAIRGVIEKSANHARFIATCNFLQKIPGPVQDRFEIFDFSLSTDEEREILPKFAKRAKAIFTKLEMEIEKDALKELIKMSFPSFRSVLNRIQSLYAQGIKTVTREDVRKHSAVYADLYKIILSDPDPVKNYSYIVKNYSNRVDDVLHSLGTEFVNWLIQNQEEYGNKNQQIASLIPVVNRHMVDRQFAIDPVVTLLSCVYSIQEILH